MLKKLTILMLLLLLLPLSSYASGFYLGAGVGRDTADFNQQITIAALSLTASNHVNGNGVLGEVFAGYGWNYNAFYLAGELEGSLSSINTTSSITTGAGTLNNKYAIRNSVGLSVLPGFKITDASLIYALAGYVRGQLRVNAQINNAANSITRNLNGFRYGLGLETKLRQQLGVRLEYDHIDYQRSNLTVTAGGATAVASVKPKSDQVIASLIWRFA